MKLKTQFRYIPVGEASVNTDDRTAEFSFSSETPVDQWFGREILSHAPGAVDMSRMRDGAPLLWNHNRNDVRGVVESAEIRPDKRGYARVRFARTAAGDEAMNLVRDRIVRGISVGYRIGKMDEVRDADGDNDEPSYLVTNWTPNEISLAPVAADPTVGVGRSDLDTEFDVPVTVSPPPAAPASRSNPMPETVPATPATASATSTVPAAPAAQPDVAAIRAEAAKDAARAERERISEINGLGARFGLQDLARTLIEDGSSLEAARAKFLENVGKPAQPVVSGGPDNGFIDASQREMQGYSIIRALRAAVTGDWSKAGFERRCSEEIAKRANRETEGFFIPTNIQIDPTMADAARAATGQRATSSTAYGATVGATGGSSLVATTLMPQSFVEVLRNKARVMQLGARHISGLVGNIEIPRQTSATSTYWVSPEGADITESEATFDKFSLSPKTIGAYSQITRQMMMQSTPDIEMLVRDDLAAVMGLGIDLAAISGTGANGQPTGILNASGVQSVALGTNGGALSFDSLIQMETLLAEQNVDETNLAYLTNAKQVGNLKLLKDTTGRYLWTQYSANQMPRSGAPGEVNGYPVARSNQVPSNLTKGTGTGLSAVLFGNWSELIIGEWGVLEIVPNPYGAGFKSGTIEIRALQSIDLALRHAVSFAVITDAT